MIRSKCAAAAEYLNVTRPVVLLPTTSFLLMMTIGLLDWYGVGVDEVDDRIKVLKPCFFMSNVLSVPVCWAVLFACGMLAKCGVRVNYTRKVNHFVLFSSSVVIRIWMKSYGVETLYTMLFSFVIFFTGCFIPLLDEVQDLDVTRCCCYTAPAAVGPEPGDSPAAAGLPPQPPPPLPLFASVLLTLKRVLRDVARTMRQGIERPEDRPHTIKWMFGQCVAYVVASLPFHYIFSSMNKQELLIVPLVVVVIGDGLAEPVGVYFSTPATQYPVPALCYPTSSPFVRSLQGSLCVFYGSHLSLLLLCSWAPLDILTAGQIFFLFIVLPPIATLTEAMSPHTLDNPILVVATSGTLLLALLV